MDPCVDSVTVETSPVQTRESATLQARAVPAPRPSLVATVKILPLNQLVNRVSKLCVMDNARMDVGTCGYV